MSAWEDKLAIAEVVQNWALWRDFADFNGIVAVASMFVAVGLSLYSLYIYLRDYGHLLRAPASVP